MKINIYKYSSFPQLLKVKTKKNNQNEIKYINTKFLNNSAKNTNFNNINDKKPILISKKLSYNDIRNDDSNVNYEKIHYSTNIKNTKDKTTQKIFMRLKRIETELTNDLSKLIKKEKIIKDISSKSEINGNPNNIISERNKIRFGLKQISESKKIKLSRLNEIKYRMNSIQDKYIKETGIYNNNCKEKLKIFLQSQVNVKNNYKFNAKLKILQKQNDELLLKMNNDVENQIKKKEEKFKKEEENKIKNINKLLEEKREEEKNVILERKSKNIKEMKQREKYIKSKPKLKEYLYQKNISDFKKKINLRILTENKKRKDLMNSIELSSLKEFNKNYQISKVKKNLEFKKNFFHLKKSWSERYLNLPKYKSHFSALLDEEIKNKKRENEMMIEKKSKMKHKQINYSKKLEKDLSMVINQNNSLNKNKNKGNIISKIKLKNINSYCNSIRNKILNTKLNNESKSSINLKSNHIDLTRDKNSQNEMQNIKLPNINSNNKKIENDIKYPKLFKNNNIYKIDNREIKNLFEKNGLNETTLDTVNSKLENLKEKKEQKALVLKYQGGIASNPELGEEVCNILIDTMQTKISLMDEIKKYVKKRYQKNMVDKGTGNIRNNIKEKKEAKKEEN